MKPLNFPSDVKLREKLEPTELAYMAGIIDGEGCITINHARSWQCLSGYTNMLQIKVAMTTYQVPYWLLDKCGGSLREQPSAHKLIYVWTISSRQASNLLSQLLPYLKNTKAQAEAAIKFQEGMIAGGYKSIEYLENQESYRLRLQELKC